MIRRVLAASASVAALLACTGTPAAFSDRAPPESNLGAAVTTAAIAYDYGSGLLSDWTTKPRSISTPAQITNVVANDGVVMFGDSLAAYDGKHLSLLMYERTGDLMAVNSWHSRPTAPTVDVLEQWKATYGLPSRVIMSVGSNDIFNPPGFRAQVDRAMAIAGPDRTVIWVNVQVSRAEVGPATKVADQRNSGWINAQLAEATASWPNLQVVHWAEFLAAKPGYRIPAYLSDGVHTSVPLGQAARNEMIVQAVKAADKVDADRAKQAQAAKGEGK